MLARRAWRSLGVDISVFLVLVFLALRGDNQAWGVDFFFLFSVDHTRSLSRAKNEGETK